MQFRFFLLGAILVLAQIPQAASLSTSDGLSLSFDPANGAVSELRLGGKSQPLLSTTTGGLSVRQAIPLTTTTLLFEDFSSGAALWNSAQNSDWNAATSYYTLMSSGGMNDSPYIRLGNGSMPGAGIALAEAREVSPGSQLRISWAGRSGDILSKYILSVRIYDAEGQDITSRSAPPSGWIYSAVSAAHVVFGMTNTTAATWEPFSALYQVPDGAIRYRLSLRYWNEGTPSLDVDNLQVDQVGGIGFGPARRLAGSFNGTDNELVQHTTFSDLGLSASIAWRAEPRLLRAHVELQQLATDAADLPLRVTWNLPVDATGWTWSDDGMVTRSIEASRNYENTFSTLSRRISIYPWTALSSKDGGLALALPMDSPRLQKSWWSSDVGLATVFDLCLSSRTLELGRGRATLDFVIYQFDPEWEFRSAAAGYYERFPQFFERRLTKEGCWLYPIPPDRIPDPADFGFAFFEGALQPPAVRQLCRDLGIGIYRYHEPWNVWQSYGDITEKPSYEERVQTLETWAAETTTARWLGAPRNETAKAVLASAYTNAEKRYPLDGHHYYWHQWGGKANQLWLCHAAPERSSPGIWNIFREWIIDERASERDGMYVDSIQADGALGNVEDYTPEHHATVEQPLTFSMENGQAVIAGPLGHYDYLDWLTRYEHGKGRTVMANIFPYAYRFYAHLLDVAGSEIMNVDESLQAAAHRRFHLYRKVNTNLLQWWKGDQLVSHEQVERYILGQLYWGFWPGIASCGGGIGWGETIERYFLHPELYERDRPLFRKYIPIIRELSTAGWEPLPWARANRPEVLLERFGSGPGKVLFTVRNTSATTVTTRLTANAARLNFRPDKIDQLTATELTTSRTIILETNPAAAAVTWELSIGPEAIAAVRIAEGVTAVPTSESLLYQ